MTGACRFRGAIREKRVAQPPRESIQLKYQLAGTTASKADGPSGPVVLVVDDDAAVTRFIGAILATSGFAAVAAYDAIQGFLVAQRQLPSMIFVDWHMPAGGGPQLLRRLQEHARTVDIPTYVITADSDAGIPAAAAQLGAKGVLRKPIEAAQLLELVAPLVR